MEKNEIDELFNNAIETFSKNREMLFIMRNRLDLTDDLAMYLDTMLRLIRDVFVALDEEEKDISMETKTRAILVAMRVNETVNNGLKNIDIGKIQ